MGYLRTTEFDRIPLRDLRQLELLPPHVVFVVCECEGS
jgi:hypothetical protein